MLNLVPSYYMDTTVLNPYIALLLNARQSSDIVESSTQVQVTTNTI